MPRVVHFEIYTDDPEAVRPFFQDVFGNVRPAAMMMSAGLVDPRMKIEIESLLARGRRNLCIRNRRLTLPPSGRLSASFACLQPLLLSTVRTHVLTRTHEESFSSTANRHS